MDPRRFKEKFKVKQNDEGSGPSFFLIPKILLPETRGAR
jgi:hypothetical protein